MKVVAFNGSPRKEGNTYLLINLVLKELQEEGIETELINITGKPFRGCVACMQCLKNKNKQCAIKDDFVNDCIEKMLEADGIILGSPTYFCNVSSEMKALIDRAGMVAKTNGDMFKHKVGAAVVAVRRNGAIQVFNSLNHFFTIGQMVVPGSSYWNMGIGLRPGEVESDDEGILTMQNLGKNFAWVLKKLH